MSLTERRELRDYGSALLIPFQAHCSLSVAGARFISVFELVRIAGNHDIPTPQGQRAHQPTNPKNRPPSPSPTPLESK